MKYLQLLAKEFKNSQEVTSELLNLSTILTLPKGTEFFFSDLHGEHAAFLHLLRSASGVIKNKIDLLYKDELDAYQRQALAHLIYYPKQQMEILDIHDDWYETQIYHLIHIAKFCSTKYTRSKVNKKLPKEYAYVITEMLNCHNDEYIQSYYHDIIQTIIDIHNAKPFIIALCRFIRDICIDWIHVIGDIYDRGPRPDLIINELMKYDQVDVQWGNHDISWMGAACGNLALMANVLRIALSYNHFDLLEDGYGINLRALSDFAREYYAGDPCLSFMPHTLDENQYDIVDQKLTAKMHKAITIIQMKLEGQMIKRHPEYKMDELVWLNQIDYKNHTVTYLGQSYPLKKEAFPTIDPQNPLVLSKEEEVLMKTIQSSFEHSEKLHRHIQFLYTNGNIYKKVNGNLLFHGCIPMDENGHLRKVHINGKDLCGQALMDELEEIVNKAYFQKKEEYVDRMWYLWCSKNSPVFGKSKLSVFEKYFIEDQEIQKEISDPYYEHIEKEQVACALLKHFGLDAKKGHIMNGHVPVKLKDGESPIKANGKLFVIDGGISKAYQPKTGIAGYTLIYDSQHLQLASHRPYDDRAKEGLLCLTPHVEIIETSTRIKNKDCDIGKILHSQKEDLLLLLQAYREGTIKEMKNQGL
ncbi:fructose-1,6-bisphosphatase [Thomasclavelia sp.]